MFKTWSFNKNHPETGDGEVFLTNVGDRDPEFRFFDEDDYLHIGWKTKRKGNVAYDINGKEVYGMKPVFVQRSELEKGGIDPDNLWPANVSYRRIIMFVAGVIVILAIIAFAILK
ncbi:MAG: hypothetical protein QY322_03965 [bacterium]|nr:MAG: hypothetical protein QY322_03965 [bacterium]